MTAEQKTRVQHYCVYNQTNECFLSLGATLGEYRFARLRHWLGNRQRRADEGCWIRSQEFRSRIGFFGARDIVYLDANLRVVHVIESLPALRVPPVRTQAESFLALPPRSIASSQTRPGHKLLICAASEMQSRLRRLHDQKPMHSDAALGVSSDAVPSAHTIPDSPAAPIACFAEGGKLAIHPIRDLTARGLFLVTRDRWPIGAEVRMSLQPSGVLHQRPITARMRVTQWGVDGVGLEFAATETDGGDPKSLYVC